MNLEFAYIRETVEDCEARIAASKAWLAMMDNALGHLPTAEQLQPAIKAVVQGVDWRDGFDGSGVSEGPNHSTVELWFDTKEQADAAHEAFLDMMDGDLIALPVHEMRPERT
jgi:hypothetical protein